MIEATRASIAGSERHQLHALEPVGRMLDQRQLEVRVRARVAVSGKMLAARGDPFLLQRLDDDRPSRATSSAVSASARSPMTGFFGFVWMSSTGV